MRDSRTFAIVLLWKLFSIVTLHLIAEVLPKANVSGLNISRARCSLNASLVAGAALMAIASK
jgi:hypothetical protein